MKTIDSNDPVREAHAAIIAVIGELRTMGVAVPMALHRAAHALAWTLAQRDPGREGETLH